MNVVVDGVIVFVVWIQGWHKTDWVDFGQIDTKNCTNV